MRSGPSTRPATRARSGSWSPASLARLTPARAAEFRRRLAELQDEFAARVPGDAPQPGVEPWGIVLAVYPLPASLKDALR